MTLEWQPIPDAELAQLTARTGLVDGERSACGRFIVAYRPRTHVAHTSLHELYVRGDRGFAVCVCMTERAGCREAAEQLVLRRAS